jgi:hypothetical protein
VVVDQLEAGLVEDASSMLLGNGQTDGIGETLTERASGDFNARSVVCFGVTRGDAVDLLQASQRSGSYMYTRLAELTRKFFKSSMDTP